MQDKIIVNLGEDHTYQCTTDIIGREGEGNSARLEIFIPEKFIGSSVYLDFEKPSGEKFRTPRLEVEKGVAVYNVLPYLLTERGQIKVQVIFITESGQTWKSSVKRYINKYSINAEDAIPEKEDFIFKAQKLLDELSNGKFVLSINGIEPDENGNVDLDIAGGGVSREELNEAVSKALEDAKASGEFDGKDGTSIHYVYGLISNIANPNGYYELYDDPSLYNAGDLVLDGAKSEIYRIERTETVPYGCTRLCSIKGDKGDKGDGLTLNAIALLIKILQHATYTEDMSSQIELLAKELMGGGGNTDGGSLIITDDGNGNVTITASGSASITDDGEGNVVITTSGGTSINDDGNGNVIIE